jgi:sigma-B regulation protein RsbU (phosphoserine phosphatase)
MGALSLRRRYAPGALAHALPAARSLASLIAAALHRAEAYELALEHQRVERELELAADIQTSFMPRRAPRLEGWDISGRIESAREASGDFIDIVELGDGRWGVLVADVSGKGIAAAIYMALARTVIRTYALDRSSSPAGVTAAANRRILEDTDDDFFVTAFYGVLDPSTCGFTYASAGHDPALLSRHRGLERLESTGVPLGLLPEASWTERTVSLEDGDVLLVHTDGVTDAQNASGEFFGADRLGETLEASRGESSRQIVEAVVTAVRDFVGDEPQTDDMSLLVVRRSSSRDMPSR